MGERKDLLKISVRKPEGKRSLGRHRHKWEGNIKIKLTEIGVWLRGLDLTGPGCGQTNQLLKELCGVGNVRRSVQTRDDCH
jgi:hypothetical protein